MSNIDLIIEERSRDIGDFLVGRLLPFRRKRMVGPFIYIDHMGPVKLGPEKYMDVDQHPHIGLSTLTYLLEGEIMHEDSFGTKQKITPGAVNWMTAGRGASHTERTPIEQRDGRVIQVHGYQIWIALPKEDEDIEPYFTHIAASDLPTWQEGTAQFKLIAGEGYDRKSPLPVHSKMFMLEIKTQGDFHLKINGELEGEIGVVLVEGEVFACDTDIKGGDMLVSKTDSICDLSIVGESHLLLFGGEAFPQERFIDWNFVSSDKEKIVKAKSEWQNKTFPKVPNDDTYIPLPSSQKKKSL